MPHLAASHVASPFSGMGQAMPHSPQWMGELSVSTQAPPQFISPCSQLLLQLPAEQTCPASHLVSHEPQRVGSFETSTHVPPQFWRGLVHITPHTPSLHVGAPAACGQTCPQAPQFCVSPVKFAQVVSHGA
ncbi:MAG: hypothetical protein ABJB12_18605 [Pseudomonadota bacterium]